MIDKFDIKDFKCHEGLNTFHIPGMTIVSGTNNSGKSSLLQSIYVLTQNQPLDPPTLLLNGELKLGNFSDILNKEKSSNETVEFALNFDKSITDSCNFNYLSINFIYVNPSIYRNIPYRGGDPVLQGIDIEYLSLDKGNRKVQLRLIDEKDKALYRLSGGVDEGYCRVNGIVPDLIVYSDLDGRERKICSNELECIINCISLINKSNIKYLRAYRADDFKDADYTGSCGIGISGEFTGETISLKWDLPSHFYDENNKPIKFSKVFDEWVQRIIGKRYRVRANKIDRDKYKVLLYEMDSGLELPLNQVGFGISQILPIITLILSSKENDTILIETPEVHLHPRLQAELVDLFVFAVMNNRKLIIETHSEHIINRIRLRIKENNNLMSKICIYFFEKNESAVIYQKIDVDKYGKINYWPQDFFDQSYYDLLGLIE